MSRIVNGIAEVGLVLAGHEVTIAAAAARLFDGECLMPRFDADLPEILVSAAARHAHQDVQLAPALISLNLAYLTCILTDRGGSDNVMIGLLLKP